MAALQKRLRKAMQDGNLRVADLARWFARPDPTIRGWVMRGVMPAGAPKDIEDVERRLAALEALIRRRQVLPLAPRLSPSERISRLEAAAVEVL